MVEQPGEDREPNPDDVPDMQLPGPEDDPVKAPRERVPNDGDLDVGDPPQGGDTGQVGSVMRAAHGPAGVVRPAVLARPAPAGHAYVHLDERVHEPPRLGMLDGIIDTVRGWFGGGDGAR